MLKRSFDYLISLAGLTIFFPGFILIAILIKIDSKGPVFFIQERVGKDGVPFRLLKFRSMIDKAEKLGHWATESSDPRVTRGGRLLRRMSLDELPQLWNVLRGDMSLVGPRPDLPVQVANYTEYLKERLKVSPGLTGLAQTCGRSDLTPLQRDELDMEYVKTHSLWLDLKILLWTVSRIISMKGTN